MDKNKEIKKAYNDTFFGSANIVYKELKNKGLTKSKENQDGITIKDVSQFISKQSLNQINKKNKGFGSYIPKEPLHQFQIDLIFIKYDKLNEGNKYAFSAIDSFSKIGWMVLMKKKDTNAIIEAFEKIIKKMGVPKEIYSDDGSEFISGDNAYEGGFKSILNKYGIKHILTPTHAPIVERFNRTIKEKVEKYKQASKTKTIVNVLPKILEKYNKTFHRTIGMSPYQAKINVEKARDNIMKTIKFKPHEPIQKGDRVRIILKHKSFDKGYKPKWSSQIYTIDEVRGSIYIINNTKRKFWLRAHLQKIGEIEETAMEPDFEGSQEQHLKDLAKAPVVNVERAEQIKNDAAIAINERIQNIKGRERKKKVIFDNS